LNLVIAKTCSPQQVVQTPAHKIIGHWLLDHFWPIFWATLFCSIRWKILPFKRHYARFIGTHRYACFQSRPHA